MSPDQPKKPPHPSSLQRDVPPPATQTHWQQPLTWCFPIWGPCPKRASAHTHSVGNIWSLLKKDWE